MKNGLLSIQFLFIISGISWSQPLPDYYSRNAFLHAPPAAFEDGLLGFANPANLALLHQPEFRFYWSTAGSDAISFRDWGVFTGIKNLGLTVQRQKVDDIGVTDFRLASGWGTRALALGLSYGWSVGKFDAQGREKLLSTGAIFRPSPFFSFGLTGNFSIESSEREGVAELAFRPAGNARLTLFADAALQKSVRVKDAPWSVGAALQVVSGWHLVGRYFKSEAFTLGLTINLGRQGVSAQTHFDVDAKHTFNTYMLRSGGMKPSIFQTGPSKKSSYLPVSLKGRVDHLKYVIFDDQTLRLLDILNNLDAAASDPRIDVLALNLSGLQVRPEHAWEIRQALQQAQQAGKRVLVFLDQVEMTGYHLASVADKIILDPQGYLILPGYALSRTYLKGTLDKMGLGFDEWRFFKYKSAMEAYSRESMSEADREQRQDFVDDWYELTRTDVCASRNLTPQEFDRLIDEEGYFSPQKALAASLVDTLARWSALDEIISNLTGDRKKALTPADLLANALPLTKWGIPPQIAVVYGLGVCALDEGIRARWLERVFQTLASNKHIKAVVFRVDSPGGDGMASDMVAEALKQCAKNKPVIISQGQVAGSGGYWISMYGSKIIAGANTITGSIGVIGGWVYDKGLSKKLGMTSDLVKRGEHADLGRGVNLLFLNIQVPARNLTPEERQMAEDNIREMYDEFVEKVAQGRNLPVEKVRQIAEGHIYSGIDGKELGLVDEIGGLLTAIAIAKQQAGIKPNQEVQIIEMPRNKGFVNLQQQLSPLPVNLSEDAAMQFIKMLSQKPGAPLPIMIPGTYPDLPSK
ncbi:MAG: signal peptide peptidase SppA [bacterium]